MPKRVRSSWHSVFAIAWRSHLATVTQPCIGQHKQGIGVPACGSSQQQHAPMGRLGLGMFVGFRQARMGQ